MPGEETKIRARALGIGDEIGVDEHGGERKAEFGDGRNRGARVLQAVVVEKK